MLDDDDGVAQIGEPVQHIQQLHVLEVQAGGRLVQQVQGASGLAFGSTPASLMRCASPPQSVIAD